MTFPKTRRARRPEDKTQAAGLQWLKLQHPEARAHIVKIDNEGKRSIAGHQNAKRCGLYPGASDLFLCIPNDKHNGMWMEVKPDGWKPRSTKEKERVEKQLAFGAKMRMQGYAFYFCVGVDEMIDAFKEYLDC